MKGAMAPLERKKNLNVVNDTRSACPPKKKKNFNFNFFKNKQWPQGGCWNDNSNIVLNILKIMASKIIAIKYIYNGIYIILSNNYYII